MKNIFGLGKRIVLFIAVNLLVLLTLSLLASVILHFFPHLGRRSSNPLLVLGIFSLIFGMGGAFISLALSRMMAKWMMGVQVIDPAQIHGGDAQWLIETVHQLARSAGLTVMPEVGIYDSPEVNAFATGRDANHAAIAVTTGALQKLNNEELEVLASDDSAEVRRLVDILRDVASELLLSKMRELGRTYLQDPDAPGLDLALWRAIQEGPERMDAAEVGDLEQVSQMAGGWWRMTGVPEPEFLSFEDWADVFDGAL